MSLVPCPSGRVGRVYHSPWKDYNTPPYPGRIMVHGSHTPGMLSCFLSIFKHCITDKIVRQQASVNARDHIHSGPRNQIWCPWFCAFFTLRDVKNYLGEGWGIITSRRATTFKKMMKISVNDSQYLRFMRHELLSAQSQKLVHSLLLNFFWWCKNWPNSKCE